MLSVVIFALTAQPAAIILATGILPLSDLSAASEHRKNFPQEDHPYVYYFTTGHLPEERREDAITALRFTLPSVTLNPVVDSVLPTQVEGHDLYWVDIRGGGWEKVFYKSFSTYPYSPVAIPMVIRADWFVVAALDASESDLYYNLLFGSRPKSRDQWLQTLGVDTNPRYSFGMIEGDSGVIVKKKRWMESFGIPRGYAWGTKDSSTITQDSDPLAHPDGSFRHEAEEWIVGIPKLHAASGRRGTLQVYLLSDAEGVVQEAAPPDIATDHTGIRHGTRAVRNGISCVSCHVDGLNLPTQNEFRLLIESGVDVYAKKGVQKRLEAFHLSDLTPEIKRANEDYETIVEAICGVPPTEAIAAFTRCVKFYDADLTIEEAAQEFGVTPEELIQAFAYGSSDGYPARLALLAHGQKLPRQSWEQYYLQAYDSVKKWKEQ